jgi:exodeoxyribonuclease VII small subunit
MKLKQVEQNPSETLSFEEALRELDEVVSLLEAGQIPLEQSLQLLRRGLELADQCDQTLQGAEAVLEELVATSSGTLETRELQWDDESDDE